MLTTALLIFFSIFGYSLFFSTRCPISLTWLFTSTSIISLLYFATWLHGTPFVTHVLFYLGIICFISFFFLHQHSLLLLKHFILHPATLFIIVIYLIMAILFQHATLINWDEFATWGVFSKNYFSFHRFPIAMDKLDMSGYPPSMMLFRDFFNETMGFSEYAMYLGQGLFFASGLASLFYTNNLKKKWVWLLTFITVYLVTFIPNDNGFHSIYVDSALGVTSAALLLSYYYFVKEQTKVWFFLIPGFMTLSLIQDTGEALALFIIGVIILDQLFHRCFLKNAWKIGLLILGLLISMLSWRLYVQHEALVTSRIFDSHFSFIKGIKVLFGIEQDPYYTIILHNFIQAVITTPISGNVPGSMLNHFISMLTQRQINFILFPASVLTWSIVLLFLSSMIFFQGTSGVNNDHRKTMRLILVLMPLCFITFLISLLFTYFFTFTSGEAVSLASFDRYVGVYIVFWTLVVFGIQLNLYMNNKTRIFPLLFFIPVLCFISLPGATIKFFVVKEENMNPLFTIVQNRLAGYQDLHAQSIYVIWQDTGGLEDRFARYILAPIKINRGCYNIGPTVLTTHTYGCANIDSPKKLQEAIKGYDYLWVGNASPEFFKRYHLSFPKNGVSQFYKVKE